MIHKACTWICYFCTVWYFEINFCSILITSASWPSVLGLRPQTGEFSIVHLAFKFIMISISTAFSDSKSNIQILSNSYFWNTFSLCLALAGNFRCWFDCSEGFSGKVRATTMAGLDQHTDLILQISPAEFWSLAFLDVWILTWMFCGYFWAIPYYLARLWTNHSLFSPCVFAVMIGMIEMRL